MIQWVLRILISQNKAKDFVMELANREIAITGERVQNFFFFISTYFFFFFFFTADGPV